MDGAETLQFNKNKTNVNNSVYSPTNTKEAYINLALHQGSNHLKEQVKVGYNSNTTPEVYSVLMKLQGGPISSQLPSFT